MKYQIKSEIRGPNSIDQWSFHIGKTIVQSATINAMSKLYGSWMKDSFFTQNSSVI